MASDKEFVDFVLDQIENAGEITAKKMFGEYGVFSSGEFSESLKPHITPVDVFFYILEGVVDIRVSDETIAVEKDNLVESPKDIVHCLSNSSGNLSRILVVKSPKPTSKAKLL